MSLFDEKSNSAFFWNRRLPISQCCCRAFLGEESMFPKIDQLKQSSSDA